MYEEALSELSKQSEIEPVLRSFELNLLELLGYGIDFSVLADNTVDDCWYHFHHDSGFEQVVNANDKLGKYFSAVVLQHIAEKNFTELETQKAAKRLLRAALSGHLGEKPISSRSLFRKNIG